jgi:hypothetical protein
MRNSGGIFCLNAIYISISKLGNGSQTQLLGYLSRELNSSLAAFKAALCEQWIDEKA